jgi:hypothetical protein
MDRIPLVLVVTGLLGTQAKKGLHFHLYTNALIDFFSERFITQ